MHAFMYIIYGISVKSKPSLELRGGRPRRRPKRRFMAVVRDEEAEEGLIEADDWL